MKALSPSRTITLAALIATAAVLLLAVGVSSASAAIKLGVYVAAQGEVGAPEDAQVLDKYAAMVGRQPDIVMDYSNVTGPLLTPQEVTNLSSRGETPLVSWQLYKSGYGGETISLADIAAGRYDASLKEAADEAKAMPFGEILLRFGHEMNGDWYGWSGDPANFVAAWRHVVDVIRSAGATNVKFVWSANVDNGSYPFAAYFPGDDYVDYVGLDGYNWGTAGVGVNKWQSLEQVFASSYAQLTTISTKPVIVTEISSSEIGGDKAAWIREGLLKTIPQKMPRVQAVVWFDRNQEEDWRIDSSEASLQAYREVVASSLYGGTVAPPAAASEPELSVEQLEITPNPTVPAPTVTTGQKPKKGGKKRARRIAYRLSRKAAVRISVTTPGQKRPRKSLLISTPRRSGQVDLTKLISDRSLRRGTYVVTATAIAADGAASNPRRAGFRVVRKGGGQSVGTARRASSSS